MSGSEREQKRETERKSVLEKLFLVCVILGQLVRNFAPIKLVKTLVFGYPKADNFTTQNSNYILRMHTHTHSHIHTYTHTFAYMQSCL